MARGGAGALALLLASGAAVESAPPQADPGGAPVLRVTSSAAAGPGTLRAAIDAANGAHRPARIEIALLDGDRIDVDRALPPLTGRGTVLDGGGVTLRMLPTCRREDGRPGCDGIVISGPGIEVGNLRVQGFTFDGFAVRGVRATDARIHDCESRDNGDDGVGVCDYAGAATIERCVLTGNGFRTKGKGVLVFDGSSAVLRGNFVAANRDGVTVSRGARATLEDNLLVENWDKGLGVFGGTVEGRGNRISGSGAEHPALGRGPNRDGLRVSGMALVVLADTTVVGSADNGVVVMDDGRVVLRGGSVATNEGSGIIVADRAELRLEGTEVVDNRRGDFHIEGRLARLVRSTEAGPEPVMPLPDATR